MPTALSLKNLHKTYKGGFIALKGIDLEVQRGDFFALLGPNGAGKSTTIGIIATLINKTSGAVKIFDHDLGSRPGVAKKMLGLVPQEFNFSQFDRVQEILINQAGYFGIPKKAAIERSEHYLKKLSIWDKRDEETRRLSGGMKRRLMIARAMMHEPPLLILDEPTAGVDIEIRRSMWAYLQEINRKGTTIILTTHNLEEAENLCRNIAIIDQGKIVRNTSMKKLLATLNTETFVVDLAKPLQSQPTIPNFAVILIDPYTLEIEVEKACSLNRLFSELDKQNIEVTSLRNKYNRLEELFLTLVNDNKAKSSHA